MNTSTFDIARADAFAEQMRGVLNGGALALMLSIGHRVGLFDAMAGLPAARPDAIAAHAGLHPRYVREWLAAMAAGGVVHLDGASGTYRLPPEHAAVLTRGAPSWNAAASAQWIPMLAAVEDLLLACFERGGGIPGAQFARFQVLHAEHGEQRIARDLLGALLPLVPGLERRLERGIDVLDLGCGTGRALQPLVLAFPRSRFRGIDLSPEAICAARAASGDLPNATFELRDATDLREDGTCDLVTAFGSLAALARPEAVLANVYRALRPGGVILVQDLALTGDVAVDARHPLAPFLYTASCLHTVSVSLAAGATGADTVRGRERVRTGLARAGFVEIESHAVPGDIAHLYHVARRAG